MSVLNGTGRHNSVSLSLFSLMRPSLGLQLVYQNIMFFNVLYPLILTFLLLREHS